MLIKIMYLDEWKNRTAQPKGLAQEKPTKQTTNFG